MSQLMMRYRVFFQLCTVGAFLGGLQYRGELPQFLGLKPVAAAAAVAGTEAVGPEPAEGEGVAAASSVELK